MGIRLWRRIKIFPGVWLNISKSGISFSFGVKGARYTVGRSGKRFTAGLPGTGLSYTTHQGKRKNNITDKDRKKKISK